MAFKKSKNGEGDKPAEPSKEPKQPVESSFEEPVIKAYSIQRRGGGWCLVSLELQGDKVINQVWSNPDMKDVALERFKVEVSRNLLIPQRGK